MSGRLLFFDTTLLPDGWAERVAIEVDAHGVIRRVEVGAAPAGDRHAIGLPGLPNLHSHTFQRGMAGLAEIAGPTPDSFWTWREVMYRFLDRLGPDDVEAIAAQAFVEMLEAGFTSVAEFHYLHHAPDGRAYADPAELSGRIVAAAEAVRIGPTLLPVLYGQGDFGGAPPTSGQRRFLHAPETFLRLVADLRARFPDLVIGIAPHSLRAVTPAALREVVEASPGGPVHIHAAEQEREVEGCLAWSGRRPVEWLLGEAPVDARWCLIHCTYMTPEETAALAASGAVAGLCPITEANLGDGIFHATDYVRHGGRFGIGTDSNVLIDAAGELRQLEYGQRLRERARNRLAPANASVGGGLYRQALTGGAQALAQPIGALAVGRRADIITLDPDHPSLVGRAGHALLDGWIFAARTGTIRDVYVGGTHVVSEGRHRAREVVGTRFAKVMRRLLA